MKSATLFPHAYANINHINTGDLLYVFHGSAGKPSNSKTSAELKLKLVEVPDPDALDACANKPKYGKTLDMRNVSCLGLEAKSRMRKLTPKALF